MKNKNMSKIRNVVEEKLFVVKKYVKAKSAMEALKKEKKQDADDCWVDEDYRKETVIRGFTK